MLYLADMGEISGTRKSEKVRFGIVGDLVRGSGRLSFQGRFFFEDFFLRIGKTKNSPKGIFYFQIVK